MPTPEAFPTSTNQQEHPVHRRPELPGDFLTQSWRKNPSPLAKLDTAHDASNLARSMDTHPEVRT